MPQRRSLLLLPALATLALAACGSAPAAGLTPRDALMANPLYASHAYDTLIAAITEMQIDGDKALSGALVGRAQSAKERTLALKDYVSEREREGLFGSFIPVAYDAAGDVLVEQDRLWTSVDFYVTPQLQPRVYLSGALDPRDLPFPSESDIDLGDLPSAFGPLGIALPPRDLDIRSVVIWDAVTKRVLAFAQVARENTND